MSKKKTAPPVKSKSIADYFIQMPPKRKLPTPSSPQKVSKKSRLSSPEPPTSDDFSIPGSVSDEESIAPSRPYTTAALDDALLSSVPSSQRTPLSYKHLTPPPSERGRSASPIQALTVEAKTAQVLASIRAKAAEAVAAQMNDDDESEFKDTLSDSDDDMTDLMLVVSKLKQDAVSTVSSTNRYNLRAPKPPKTHSPANDKVAASVTKHGRRKYDPMAELLKEVQKDKGGRDVETRRRAECTASGKDLMRPEMDQEDADDLDDEGALLGSDSFEEQFDADDERRLYGNSNGAIKSIIDTERERSQEDRQEESKLGLPFWTEAQDSMDFEAKPPPPDFGDLCKYPILRCLHDALQNHDDAQATFLLNSGFLTDLDVQRPGVIEHVCDLALARASGSLSQAAFYALLNRWSLSRLGPGITFALVWNVVTGFGANTQLPNLSFSSSQSVVHCSRTRNVQEKEFIISRLTALLGVCAWYDTFDLSTHVILSSVYSSHLLDHNDIPDITLMIVAIALDASTSPSLNRDIMLCLDKICRSIQGEDSKQSEIAICNKILKYISLTAAVNQVRAVSLLASGVGRTIRIARWLAYACIAGQTEIASEHYADSLPLRGLSAYISSSGTIGARNVFKIDQDANYHEMEYHAQLLDIALSDISMYMHEEISAGDSQPSHSVMNSPSKPSVEKPDTDTPLMSLWKSIEAVHTKINDTRGTRLERSRTKAVLKNLSLRIHYQRDSALKSTARTKTKKMEQYFAKKA
ncbi:hypothetical protein D9758_002027 [Tetrapyrgos nigripes]|uniref:Uncharacterized protein n=1 Tax=Tetrapyrgos nigripes TaxID=182062 RepID=A0A8H5LVD3_9AGAR|nr:hypothetical protein D9758_002027 [Tetrapyrgos nigripes]